ncbi:MAG: hypothetical protein JNK48_21010, partial [Bryobacterales bacterium]|nr:hypothetical protein [Bryobacterales bacterium]
MSFSVDACSHAELFALHHRLGCGILQSLAASLPLPQALQLVYDWHCHYGFAPEARQSVPHPHPRPQPRHHQ